MKLITGLILAVSLLIPSLGFGQTVGFDFLRTFVGARPSSMSGAFIAVPGDIHNIAYNPAGLAELNERTATITYLNHLLDFQSGFMAYAQPIADGTAGIGLHFFDYGNFAGKDESNNDTGDFGASSISLSVGYASRFFKNGFLRNLLLGGNAKFIRFQIDDLTSTALGVDLGLVFMIPSKQLNIGFGVFNWGTTTSAFIESKDDLPLNFQLGVSKKLTHLPLMIAVSLVRFRGAESGIDGIDLRLGGEFSLTEQLFLRLGYNSVGQDQKVNSGKDNLAGVSLGLGFKVNSFNIDYSLSSFGEVGAVNRISLLGRF